MFDCLFRENIPINKKGTDYIIWLVLTTEQATTGQTNGPCFIWTNYLWTPGLRACISETGITMHQGDIFLLHKTFPLKTHLAMGVNHLLGSIHQQWQVLLPRITGCSRKQTSKEGLPRSFQTFWVSLLLEESASWIVYKELPLPSRCDSWTQPIEILTLHFLRPPPPRRVVAVSTERTFNKKNGLVVYSIKPHYSHCHGRWEHGPYYNEYFQSKLQHVAFLIFFQALFILSFRMDSFIMWK